MLRMSFNSASSRTTPSVYRRLHFWWLIGTAILVRVSRLADECFGPTKGLCCCRTRYSMQLASDLVYNPAFHFPTVSSEHRSISIPGPYACSRHYNVIEPSTSLLSRDFAGMSFLSLDARSRLGNNLCTVNNSFRDRPQWYLHVRFPGNLCITLKPCSSLAIPICSSWVMDGNLAASLTICIMTALAILVVILRVALRRLRRQALTWEDCIILCALPCYVTLSILYILVIANGTNTNNNDSGRPSDEAIWNQSMYSASRHAWEYREMLNIVRNFRHTACI